MCHNVIYNYISIHLTKYLLLLKNVFKHIICYCDSVLYCITLSNQNIITKMQYISLNNSSLTYFTSKGSLTEMSGSSKYNVVDNEIVMKKKSPNGRIENKTATLGYLQAVLNDKLSDKLITRIIYNYLVLWAECKREKFTSEIKLTRLELFETVLLRAYNAGEEVPIKYAITNAVIAEQNSRYTRAKK